VGEVLIVCSRTVFYLSAELCLCSLTKSTYSEKIDIDERELGGDVPGVHPRYNQTDPDVIEDGIDFVAIVEEPEGVYRIDYWGYDYGRLRITTDGVEQLGQDLLDNPDMIPNWTLDPETADAEDLPWWVPDNILVAPTVTCESCGSDVPVREVVTPRRSGVTDDIDVLCRDCWEEYG
jgi:hypothetical protein